MGERKGRWSPSRIREYIRDIQAAGETREMEKEAKEMFTRLANLTLLIKENNKLVLPLPPAIDVNFKKSDYILAWMGRRDKEQFRRYLFPSAFVDKEGEWHDGLTLYLDDDTLKDEQIALLMFPALPIKKDIEPFDAGKGRGISFVPFFQFLSLDWEAMITDPPESYKPEDWKPGAIHMILAQRIGEKLYSHQSVLTLADRPLLAMSEIVGLTYFRKGAAVLKHWNFTTPEVEFPLVNRWLQEQGALHILELGYKGQKRQGGIIRPRFTG